LSKKLQIDENHLFDLFIKREKDSSTVIAPGLAIPHIIIEGKEKFDILIVRSKKGIVFPEETEPVHALFILVGSADERNFHLRALAAIAQIAQEKNFNKKWRDIHNKEGLRNFVLLSQRKRHGGAI